jgi:5-oxoprolinase (ATP-hydrolysing) subunit A
MTMLRDINCDLGEHANDAAAVLDAQLAAHVTRLNIACAGHAGDESSMRRLLQLAKARSLLAGPHPSYPDRANFGRVTLDMPPSALEASIASQLRSFVRIAQEESVIISHVKPHGALYHDMANPQIAAAIAQAVVSTLGRIPVIVPATINDTPSRAHIHMMNAGVAVVREAFADRGYDDAGHLLPRSHPHALLAPVAAAAQARDIAAGHVTSCTGSLLRITCDTICIHGDGPEALETARLVQRVITSHA